MASQKYLDAQYQVAISLQKGHMGDVLTEAQFSNYSEHLYAALNVIANCGLDQSLVEASKDISAILHAVAMQMAKKVIDASIEDSTNERAATEYELRKMERMYA